MFLVLCRCRILPRPICRSMGLPERTHPFLLSCGLQGIPGPALTHPPSLLSRFSASSVSLLTFFSLIFPFFPLSFSPFLPPLVSSEVSYGGVWWILEGRTKGFEKIPYRFHKGKAGQNNCRLHNRLRTRVSIDGFFQAWSPCESCPTPVACRVTT